MSMSDTSSHDQVLAQFGEYKYGSEVFRQLLDNAPDSAVVVDNDGQIVLVNLQTERLFGYDRHELMGQKVEVLIPERLRPAHVGHRSQFASSPKVRPMGSGLELFGRKSDGTEFPLEISLSPLNTTQGTLISANIRDISDRKRSEEELRRARALAEAASSAKTEFLSSMSHELRTPLNAILGFAQLLQRDRKEPLSDRHRERIEHVLKGGEHLLRLIDEVLDLSRIEAGRVSVSLESVDVAEVLAEVGTTLEPMATRAEIQLLVQPIALGSLWVNADRTRFKQILMNYGSNAIKYGRKHGMASFSAIAKDGRVRVCVRDDGSGIPEDKQDKIFQPFHRAGQETGPIEGTGIGLAIAKRLAELMHGTVGFRSVEGTGSEFWVELPFQHLREDVETEDFIVSRVAASPLFGEGDGSRYRIIYIEDNPSDIAFMKDLIADFDGVDLETAPTAEVGIELVRAHRPNVVIMDINLPGMNGLEATRRLREWPETRNIPVVALSAGAMVRDAKRINEAGFYRYLTKPVRVAELADLLEEILIHHEGDTRQ